MQQSALISARLRAAAAGLSSKGAKLNGVENGLGTANGRDKSDRGGVNWWPLACLL